MATNRDWPLPAGAAAGIDEFEARRIIKPSEVENGIPDWFAIKLNGYATANKIEVGDLGDGDKVRAVAKQNGMKWLEHVGKTTVLGKSYFVSEPFHFASESAKQLDEFCERIGGIEWFIHGTGWHSTGSTIRILIRETTA